MTSLPCSVLPRTLRFVLLALAWLAMPMWPVVVAGAWLFDIRGVIISTAFTTVCTFALFAVFFTGRVDSTFIKPAEEREQVYQAAIRRLGNSTTRPQPVLRRLSS